MKKKVFAALILSGILFSGFAGAAQTAVYGRTEKIGSEKLSVTVGTVFPRIVKYELGKKVFRGALIPDNRVVVNGKSVSYRVDFRKKGEDQVSYQFTFPGLDLSFQVVLSVKGQSVEGKIEEIREGKDQLYTLSFPDQQLLSVTSKDKSPAYIWCRMIPMVDSPDVYAALSASPVHGRPETANYVFAETGELAAGILSNVIDERERVAFQVRQTDEGKVCRVWCPVWTYREVPGETLENPWFKVVVAGDENRDGKVDWQDAALLYRAEVKRPFRAGEVKRIVSSQIGFNASHLAENPFLRMFDNMKKCALLLDFLPQDLLVKGYQGGGHDSSVPDYAHPNEQAGGFADLNYMIDHGRDINLHVGLHINCTEAYPESRYFDPDILTKELGWLWGDQAVLIDKKKDLKSGKLFRRIDEMFDSVPNIDFLYVDTYQDRGWPLIKIREKLESYHQRMFTEFDVAMDGVSTWSHGRVRLKGRMARFIWNDCRDIFRLDPLLLGAEHHGINGWEGEASVPRFVREVYTRNLPTKFLQHFPLMSWTDECAVFGSGVRMERRGAEVCGTWNDMTFFNGMWDEAKRSFSDVAVFIPWESTEGVPERIFAWDDSGVSRRRVLPASWKGIKKAYLYRLTDRGRIFEKVLPVTGRAVAFRCEGETPYVLYARKADEIRPETMKWGEGQPVGDPGFNDYTLSAWEKTGRKEAVRVVTDGNGQTVLELAQGENTGVCQRIGALDKNMSYYISARVLVKGEESRKVTLEAEALKEGKVIYTVHNYLDRTSLNGVPGWQRVRVLFDMPDGADDVRLRITAAPGGASVWADDVRAYRTTVVEKEGDCVLAEDFELRDAGWGPFVNVVKGSVYTDLSEFNPGRTADVINGNFSLKTWNQKKGLLYRTTPGLLRLDPNQRYEIVFDYLCDRDDCYELVVKECDKPEGVVLLRVPVKRGKGTIRQSFSTSGFADAWIGVEKKNNDPVIFVMDDLKIFAK